MRTVALLLALLARCAFAQYDPFSDPAFVAQQFVSSGSVDYSLPPTNTYYKSSGNPIANSSGHTAENTVLDNGVYYLMTGNGSGIGIWTNGVNPAVPGNWGFVSNLVTDTPSTPTPHLLIWQNYCYLFYNTVAGIGVASNATPYGPFTNSTLLVTHSTGYESSRVLENFVFRRADGKWVMLYMGDSGSTTEQIGYALADSPVGPYTKYVGNPLIAFGATYDAQTIADPWAVEWNGTYYIGYAASPYKTNWQTALGWTTDFTNFTKYGVVISSNALSWDTDNNFRGAMIKSGRNWVLAYTGDNFKMGLALVGADSLAPNISGITADTNTGNITWTTDIPAGCSIAYGTSSGSYGAAVTEVSTNIGQLSHYYTIPSMANSTTYYFKIYATNCVANGQSTSSTEQSFKSLPVWSPTNITGYPALAYYEVSSSGYVTNSGTATLLDVGPNGWHLTNKEAAKFPVRQVSATDSHDALAFNAANTCYLRNDAYTNANPSEVVMICALTNTGTTIIFDGTNASNRQVANVINSSGAQIQIAAGTTLGLAGLTCTNKYALYHFAFNGTQTAVYTNNVRLGNAGNAGNGIGNGFKLGARYTDTLPQNMAVLEMGMWVTNLDTASRSNFYRYATNKYPTAFQ